MSDDVQKLKVAADEVISYLKKDSRLIDLDTSYREGKREFSFELDPGKAEVFGMNTSILGQELRAQVQGIPATVFRENGYEYDVRVLMKEDQRNIRQDWRQVNVMNLNNKPFIPHVESEVSGNFASS